MTSGALADIGHSTSLGLWAKRLREARLPNEAPVVVKQGTFLYAGEVVWHVRIYRTGLRPGTGDPEDPPEWRDDQHGEFYCVQFGWEREAYHPWGGPCFESLSEAMQHVDEVLRPSGGARWTD